LTEARRLHGTQEGSALANVNRLITQKFTLAPFQLIATGAADPSSNYRLGRLPPVRVFVDHFEIRLAKPVGRRTTVPRKVINAD
jgi:hypothetical protein